MTWLGTMLGVLARSPDTVQGIAFMVVLPLTFIASAFVPIAGLPSGLRDVASYNPISAFAAGIRTLFGNPRNPTRRTMATPAPRRRSPALVPSPTRRRYPRHHRSIPPTHHGLTQT